MKKVFISLIVIIFVFFAFYKAPFTLEGKWTGKEIVLNGKKINTSPQQNSMVHFIYEDDTGPYIKINDWSDSLYILGHSYKIKAKIKLDYNKHGKSYLMMSSNEKALNGRFELKIDTVYIYPNDPGRRYTVYVELLSGTTHLNLQREVYPPPTQKFSFPQKGRP